MGISRRGGLVSGPDPDGLRIAAVAERQRACSLGSQLRLTHQDVMIGPHAVRANSRSAGTNKTWPSREASHGGIDEAGIQIHRSAAAAVQISDLSLQSGTSGPLIKRAARIVSWAKKREEAGAQCEPIFCARTGVFWHRQHADVMSSIGRKYAQAFDRQGRK